MLTTDKYKQCLVHTSDLLILNKIYLCELDSVFADGDHGVTIEKIAKCMKRRASETINNDSIKKINDELSCDFMNINGGSAGPLWAIIFESMSENIDDKNEIDVTEFKNMFSNIKVDLSYISKAKIGDKTLVDALYPAIDTILNEEGDIYQLLKLAYEKSKKGAENTKKYSAKFGRAKSAGDNSIGHLDPGAVSISLFFKGIYDGFIMQDI